MMKKLWTRIHLDAQSRVVGIENPNDRLCLGDIPATGELFGNEAGAERQAAAKRLTDAVSRARREERNVSLTYYWADPAGGGVHVSAHAEFTGNGEICLHLTEIDPRDLAGGDPLASENIDEQALFSDGYSTLHHRFHATLDSMPAGVVVYNTAGEMVYFNESFCRIFGVDSQLLKQTSFNLNTSPELPEEMKSAVREKRPVDLTIPYDFEAVTRKGYFDTVNTQTHYIKCSGSPVLLADGTSDSYVFILTDVTDAVRNAEELEQSRLKTELAIRASDIVLWEFDVRQQLFFSDNEPLNGFDRSKPVSIKKYTETVHPEDRETIAENIRKMAAGEDFSFSVEGRILFPEDPEYQYCIVSGSPFERDKHGRVVKYVGTRKNNTEQQKRRFLQEKILNNIPMSIMIKDVENDFRYVFCNEESKRMFGTSEEKTTYDILDAGQVSRIQKTDLEVFNTGNPYLGLERITLKDGRSYDTIVRKSIIREDDKRLLLNVRWDQGLQNDLERRSKLLSVTMEVMNAYTWSYEPDKNRISYGPEFEKICSDATQYTTLEQFLEGVHPDDRQHFYDSLHSVTSHSGGEWSTEYRIDLMKEGNYEWWETRGILETSTLNDAPYKYMFGMSINIDGHKQTELTLLKNKEHLNQLIRQNELVLNNTNSGLAYITTDYVVQWENISMCSASLSYEAYKKGELCYKSAHNRTSPCENCVMQRAMKSQQVEQIKFHLDDNHTMEVFATPVMTDNGKVEGVVIRMDNVTERESMIAQLRQAKTQAEQSDKLKSAFLANMSHEIRTPLNAIVGFSELLQTAETDEEKEEYIRIIGSNNELLLKLINDILDLSKIEAGSVELRYEQFDLSQHFDSMAASMRQRIAKPEVELIAVNPYPECQVVLDRNRIAQIITNYVTNAIKYTPKGSIEMGYAQERDGIRFYVKDSGIGIPDEKRSRVFHRFEKLDDFAQGTGLGLSICKAIAESMGGSVGFESVYGQGSTFWAKLPCKSLSNNNSEVVKVLSPAGIEGGGNSEVETNYSISNKTILIAEDMPSNYLLASTLLRKFFHLVHAENGQQAVEIVHKQPIDLVLMDMKMPVMDGLTATAQIRKIAPQLPIVALTAHAFESDRQAALEAGCNDYLVKPIDKVKLIAVLHKYFGKTAKQQK